MIQATEDIKESYEGTHECRSSTESQQEHRKLRIKHIAKRLLDSSSYTFVFLQEIWITSDFLYLQKILKPLYPHSIRFASGIIGSGLCFFSKVPICHFFFFPFSVNGYFYKFWHGDWFSGKGVGVCTVNFNGLKMNLFTTHIHVESRKNTCEPHRIAQFLSLIDLYLIINQPRPSTSLSILAGDFNCEPDNILIKCLFQFTGLQDSYNAACVKRSNSTLCACCHVSDGQCKGDDLVNYDKGFVESNDRETLTTSCTHQGTCGIPTNAYSTWSQRKKQDGSRLDYVAFENLTPDQGTLDVIFYDRPFPNRIPHKQHCSYSDHEAVAVTFLYKKNELDDSRNPPQADSPSHHQYNTPELKSQDQRKIFQQLSMSLTSSISKIHCRIHLFLLVSVFLLLLLAFSIFDKGLWEAKVRILSNITRVILSMFIIITAFIQPILLRQEIHALEMGLFSLLLKLQSVNDQAQSNEISS